MVGGGVLLLNEEEIAADVCPLLLSVDDTLAGHACPVVLFTCYLWES